MKKSDMKKAFKRASKKASEGHYLDRKIAIAKELELTNYKKLFDANKLFLDSSHKPAGLNELILDFSRLVCSMGKQAGLTLKDFELIAWGLDWAALKEFDLIEARKN